MCENGILTFTTNAEFKEIETYLIKRSSKCLKGLFLIVLHSESRWVGGGGVFELGTPEGRGPQAVLEIQVDGG